MYYYRRFYLQKIFFIIMILVCFFALFSIFKFLLFNEKTRAQNAVERFYLFEQEGNFAKSWDMFHPFMKERFDKKDYIRERSHIFYDHFGVDSFDFTISKAKKIKNWKLTSNQKPIDIVYQFHVVQTFKGKYGIFQITQEVIVVKIKREWTILWVYP